MFDGKQKFEMNLVNIVLVFILFLLIIQAFGLIFGEMVGLEIYLGPIFVLIPISFASFLAFAIAKKMIQDDEVSKKDIIAIIFTVVLALIFMLYLKPLVPEIFKPALEQIQSLIAL